MVVEVCGEVFEGFFGWWYVEQYYFCVVVCQGFCDGCVNVVGGVGDQCVLVGQWFVLVVDLGVVGGKMDYLVGDVGVFW